MTAGLLALSPPPEEQNEQQSRREQVGTIRTVGKATRGADACARAQWWRGSTCGPEGEMQERREEPRSRGRAHWPPSSPADRPRCSGLGRCTQLRKWTRERRKAGRRATALLLLSLALLATPVTVAGCSAFVSIAGTPREKSSRYQRNDVISGSRLPAWTGGDWSAGKRRLRDPSTCVVTIDGLQEQLEKIQSCFCSEEALTE